MSNHNIICGENRTVLQSFDINTFDSCITDPPYGMGMDVWDKNVPPVDTWKEVFRVLKPGAFLLSFCSPELYHRMAVNIEDAGFKPIDMIFWIVTTKMAKANRLKPAHEPIMVAQKPLQKSIGHNQEKWGCGRINIEFTKIPWEGKPPTGWIKGGGRRRSFGKEVEKVKNYTEKDLVDADPNGRYPSNVIGYLDDQEHQKYFYAPRVTRKERGEYNDHPTPKPINLMRYLCRIYSPKGGLVLDPFCGSGSTGIAAKQESMNFVGIDLSDHYCQIAEKRIEEYSEEQFEKLFDYE